MLTEWRLREEILRLTHSWHLPLIAFLLGALLGWGASFLLPTPYRAESGLNVMYNSDALFRNPDDYKNWQMNSLELFVVSDRVLEATLRRLRTEDPYWESVNPADLRPSLHAYWRNAGRWRLVAEDRDPARAEAVVRAWGEASLEEVQNATRGAQKMLEMEAASRRLANEKVDLRQRVLALEGVQAALQSWSEQVSASEPARGLDPLERWRLLTLASRIVSADPAGQALLEELPEVGSPVSDTLPWTERALVSAQDELQRAQTWLAEAEAQFAEIYRLHDEAYGASGGLTAFLRVEPLPGVEIQAQALRPGPLLALVGGVLGLLAWALLWLALPLVKAARGSQPAGARLSHPEESR